MTRTIRLACALALPVLGGVGACSSSSTSPDGASDAAMCTRADPTCPADVPSYATMIHPILLSTCATCHYPASPYAESSLVTYEDVALVYGAALGQVSACLMPPPARPQLTDEQRAALLGWLACGAPEN